MSTFFFLTNTQKKRKIVNFLKSTQCKTFYLLLKKENTIMTKVCGRNFSFILKKKEKKQHIV